MPIYEYACQQEECSHKFEVMARLSDLAPLCPKCGNKVKKLVSIPNFACKGSGWAKDGYQKATGTGS